MGNTLPEIPEVSSTDPYLQGYAAGYAAAATLSEPAVKGGDLVLVTSGPLAGMTGYAISAEFSGQTQLRFKHYGSDTLWYIPEGGMRKIFP